MRRRSMNAAIQKSRQVQIAKRQSDRMALDNEERNFRQFWNTRNGELDQAEAQEKEEERVRH